MKHYIIKLLFYFISLLGYSQVMADNILNDTIKDGAVKNIISNKSEKNQKKRKPKEIIDDLQAQIIDLQVQLDAYKKKDSIFTRREKELERYDSAKSQFTADSLRIVEQNVKLQNRIELLDRNTARFCYIRLAQKYKKTWVDEAIECWKTISTPSVKEEYRETDMLLEQYAHYYAEIRDVIIEAQNDKRGRTFDDVSSDYKQVYWNKMKKTEYFSKYYINENINIPYLNQQIDSFKTLLDKQLVGKYDLQILLEYTLPEIIE